MPNRKDLRHAKPRFRLHRLDENGLPGAKPMRYVRSESDALHFLRRHGDPEVTYCVRTGDGVWCSELTCVNAEKKRWRRLQISPELKEDAVSLDALREEKGVSTYSDLNKAVSAARGLVKDVGCGVYVFDIDGTLLDGRRPVSPVCKWFRQLVKHNDHANVVLLTARPERERLATVAQLLKQRLDGYAVLEMFPSDEYEKTPANVARWKLEYLRALGENVVMMAGDHWYDVGKSELDVIKLLLPAADHPDPDADAVDLELLDRANRSVVNKSYVLGPNWLKLPTVG